jgi:ABC-2 type transport system ATP-binding protein
MSPHGARQREGPLAIQARGLAKSYPIRGGGGPGGACVEAVRGVDLDVAAGETFAFLGPNGAGKTTTIAMLCALARPTGGRARVAGADVATQPQLVRRSVGLLFQNSALDPELTARQNLYVHARLYGLSRPYVRERTAALLDLAGLADRGRDPVRGYSGGMRRRLEIARGLLHSPRVLFLDEPTVGLDPHARARIWEHLRALRTRQGTTLFVTTHYLEEAENCDRIAIIDAGRIVAHGTPRDLKAAIGQGRLHLKTSDDNAAARLLRPDRASGASGASGNGAAPGDLPSASSVQVDAHGVTLGTEDANAWIPKLCAALARRGITVNSVSATPPTLDDVFFHHTGRNINVEEGQST